LSCLKKNFGLLLLLLLLLIIVYIYARAHTPETFGAAVCVSCLSLHADKIQLSMTDEKSGLWKTMKLNLEENRYVGWLYKSGRRRRSTYYLSKEKCRAPPIPLWLDKL
jgi:hypothetical protein